MYTVHDGEHLNHELTVCVTGNNWSSFLIDVKLNSYYMFEIVLLGQIQAWNPTSIETVYVFYWIEMMMFEYFYKSFLIQIFFPFLWYFKKIVVNTMKRLKRLAKY